MAQARRLRCRSVEQAGLPYVSNASPVGRALVYVKGQNILTSYRGFAERRPGTEQYGNTLAGKTIRRVFTWENREGRRFVMLAATDASNSHVYKMEIGVDGSFVLALTDVSSTEPFDFCISNDTCWLANGNMLWRFTGDMIGASWTGPWGVGNGPMYGYSSGHPTIALVAGTLDATVGYRYVYAYGNSTLGSISDVSEESESTGSFDDKKVQITGRYSNDTQVDEVHVYRTTDGGGGNFWELPSSPIANVVGVGNFTFDDETVDDDLTTILAPIPGINTSGDNFGGANDRIKGVSWWNNRIWGVRRNELRYTGWEEVLNGVEEECWPDDNCFVFNEQLVGTAATNAGLLVFGTSTVWRITGDSVDTFVKGTLFRKMGARSRFCITEYDDKAAWLDNNNILRVTDGVVQQAVSLPIAGELKGINHAQAGLAFFANGDQNWLCLLDGGNSKLFAFDLDMQRWMPPWTVTGRSIAMGEIAAATNVLFVGRADGKVAKFNSSLNQDLGTPFSAYGQTNLFDTVGEGERPGSLGELEYVILERNSIAFSDVLEVADDDPLTTAGTTIAANRADPPLRTQGTNLKEDWYYARSPAARRVAVRFDYAAADDHFITYAFALAFMEMT